MAFHIVGLDLSLTATGVAVIRPHEETRKIRVSVVRSKSVDSADYNATLERLRGLLNGIVKTINFEKEEGDIVVIVMEGPIFPSTKMLGMYHTRAGLWWLAYHFLSKIGLVVVVEPTKLKSYVTGKGNTPKAEVFATMVRNFPDVTIGDDNEADALGLANMAARELGFPQEPSVQRCNPSALEGVRWPAAITEHRLAQR